eukprot:CAMPEP_0179035956 /NCGR_PEP_ID=MMETSP0796-20121207/13371_1 /TAXON_ID=73915 /ORGANISM="Pyrodinium bahamense, Strain pbaha01" /LENGTH=118 /DNA_ID=CAMNT_0020732231 /DNA_START=57 /DNA_END=409 /DNA_ORIENTATION=+
MREFDGRRVQQPDPWWVRSFVGVANGMNQSRVWPCLMFVGSGLQSKPLVLALRLAKITTFEAMGLSLNSARAVVRWGVWRIGCMRRSPAQCPKQVAEPIVAQWMPLLQACSGAWCPSP